MDLATIVRTVQAVLASLAILLPAAWGATIWIRRRWGRVSWHHIETATLKLHAKICERRYRPVWIVCLGRAGGVVGALLSEKFGAPIVPLAVLNFEYRQQGPESSSSRVLLRTQRPVSITDFKNPGGDILVLGIDIITGETMMAALAYLKENGIASADCACLFWNPDGAVTPTYWVEKTNHRLTYPWNAKPFLERHSLS